nr:hypothetical protein [Tanacetum cinerariifolium]
DNPHQTLKGQGIIDSGCSRHITGNKAYLVEYQDFNGGSVAFEGSKGQITDKENKANKTIGPKEANNSVGTARARSINYVNTTSTPINTASTPVNTASPSRSFPSLEGIYEVPNDGIFTSASYDDEGAVADFINLESTVNVSHIPQSRIHYIYPTTQILRDPTLAV